MAPKNTTAGPASLQDQPSPDERCVSLSRAFAKVKPASEAELLIAQAKAINYWPACFSRLERLLISHAHRALDSLPNSAVTARLDLIRECRTRLMRHLELTEGRAL